MAVTSHSSAFAGAQHDWALETFVFGPFSSGIASGTVVLGTDGSYPLMALPYDADIEKITARMGTLAAANSDTLQFKVAASGTAIGSGSNITAAEELKDQWTADVPKDIPFSGTGHKSLPSGTLLGITTAGTVASVAGLVITVVLRKKPSLTNTAGNPQYLKTTP